MAQPAALLSVHASALPPPNLSEVVHAAAWHPLLDRLWPVKDLTPSPSEEVHARRLLACFTTTQDDDDKCRALLRAEAARRPGVAFALVSMRGMDSSGREMLASAARFPLIDLVAGVPVCRAFAYGLAIDYTLLHGQNMLRIVFGKELPATILGRGFPTAEHIAEVLALASMDAIKVRSQDTNALIHAVHAERLARAAVMERTLQEVQAATPALYCSDGRVKNGLAVLIHVAVDSAAVGAMYMAEALSLTGFRHLVPLANPSVAEVRKVLEAASASGEFDALCLFFDGHGAETHDKSHQLLFLHNNAPMLLQEFWHPFENACWQDKPKLMFVNACRKEMAILTSEWLQSHGVSHEQQARRQLLSDHWLLVYSTSSGSLTQAGTVAPDGALLPNGMHGMSRMVFCLYSHLKAALPHQCISTTIHKVVACMLTPPFQAVAAYGQVPTSENKLKATLYVHQ